MDLYIKIFISFCMFVIGTLFGSFFSLATYRLPRHQDIIIKRSYCPNCKHNLSFFDLIPIFSYIFSCGKCRYCKGKINIRYLVLEISNGILFLLFYLVFGYTLKLLIISLVYAILFVIIGSEISKYKMNDGELEGEKKNKTKLKKGVYLSEIVIAMILFTLLIASSYVISRNYNKSSIYTIARSNAVSLAVKNLELSKATKYDLLEPYNIEIEENGIKYFVVVDIENIKDKTNVLKEEITKKISVNVKYNLDFNDYEYSISTIKGGVANDE